MSDPIPDEGPVPFRILLGCTGSVASIKVPPLVTAVLEKHGSGVEVRIVATEKSLHFFKPTDIPENVPLLTDKDEWAVWTKKTDPVLHIELRNWADLLIIAPLDANTLAKSANGICDNLLTCILRAWNTKKPVVVCPAMNTAMYEHPFTADHLAVLSDRLGYRIIPPIEKLLACGDYGVGAMAEVSTILAIIDEYVSK